MYPQDENLLLASLLKGELKIKDSDSKIYLERISQSQSSESINDDPTASQSEVPLPELAAPLLTKLRSMKRANSLFQRPAYSHSNTIEIKIWTQGFIIIKTAEQEISIWNYACEPAGAAAYRVELSGLDITNMSNKIQERKILGRHWDNFGKNCFRAKNETANGAILAYSILKTVGIDKILAFSCYEVDTKTINMDTLKRILTIAKQTENEDLSKPMVNLDPKPQKKRSIDDAIFNIVLISMINNGIIEEPKQSNPHWELTARHEDLQCFLNLNYEKVNSTELKDWFESTYNKEPDKLEHRNELIKLINDIQEKKNQTVKQPVQNSQHKNNNLGSSNSRKHKICLVM
jgi:hypothetical protein